MKREKSYLVPLACIVEPELAAVWWQMTSPRAPVLSGEWGSTCIEGGMDEAEQNDDIALL